jgi:hypothetical protein
MRTVKETVTDNLNLLEKRLTSLKELKHNIELGIENLSEAIDKEKKYLESLK